MKADDIKQGMQIQLKNNGWVVTMDDNDKGDCRWVSIGGFPAQRMTVDADDIASVLTNDGWEHVEIDNRIQGDEMADKKLTKCLKCGNDKLNDLDNGFEPETIWKLKQCATCHYEWYEVYTFAWCENLLGARLSMDESTNAIFDMGS